MTTPVVHEVAVDGLEVAEPETWRADLERRLRAGQRAVTIFGRRQGTDAVLTAVLQGEDAAIHVTRTRLDPERGYHSLTPEFPGLHCFERELHEQLDLRVAGHPWQKPMRFEKTGRAMRDAYPFYAIEGKEVHEVAVGPIHAGVIEPGSFRFMCLGEQVHHLEIHLGYQHRGVEALLLRGDARSLASLVETIAGDTSVAHAWAYSAAVEALADVDVGPDVEAPRGVMLELERVAMHLAGLSGLSADVGFLQGASTYGRLRTTAINTSMRLCGSRFGRGAMRPCGLGARLGLPEGSEGSDDDALSLAELRRSLTLLKTDMAIIDDCFLSARTVRHRLEGTGRLTREQTEQLGLVGMAARSGGVRIDQRSIARGVYVDTPIAIALESSGDCWARARLRIEESRSSLAWIERVLDRHPTWTPSRRAAGPLIPKRLVITLVEGWRGEVVHCLETDDDGRLAHYKVQDPSFRNWLGVAIAVRENEISDFPICNKSFDLSYCGSDL